MTDTLFGRQFEQDYPSLCIIDQFLLKVRPKGILEIGTGEGGFALYLAVFAKMNLDADATVATIDPQNRRDTKALLQKMGAVPSGLPIIFYQTMVQLHAGKFKSFVSENKPAVIFCDPTKKFLVAGEVAKWLSPGDYLLVHDFLHPESGGMTEEEAVAIEAMGYERDQPEAWTERGSWLCLRRTDEPS